MSERRIAKNSEEKMLFGVCSGLADYLNVDPVIVRLVFVLLVLFGNGIGILVYLLLAILMPDISGPTAKANAFDEEEIVIKES